MPGFAVSAGKKFLLSLKRNDNLAKYGGDLDDENRKENIMRKWENYLHGYTHCMNDETGRNWEDHFCFFSFRTVS